MLLVTPERPAIADPIQSINVLNKQARIMMKQIVIVAGLLSVIGSVNVEEASARDPLWVTHQWNQHFASSRPWHGPYYDQTWGQPLAVIVPPTAHMRQTYSWGVSQNLNHPIYHQFQSGQTSPGAIAPGQMRPTPGWPSHTDQFGQYYVRGPW